MREAAMYWRRHKVEGVWLGLVIAIATGVAITVWSIGRSVWFETMGFSDPDRLVSVGWTTGQGTRMAVNSADEFQDLKQGASDFLELATWENGGRWFLRSAPEPVQVVGTFVTTDLFDILGARVLRGRVFLPSDGDVNGTSAVISERCWRLIFNSDPNVIGKAAVFALGATEERSVTIVGVLAAQQALRDSSLREIDVMVAGPDGPRRGGSSSRRAWDRVLVGRLRPGVNVEAAEARLTPLLRAVDEQHPLGRPLRSGSVVSLHEYWFGASKPFLRLIGAAAGFLLIVAVVNGAGVMLVLSGRRAREMAVRAAIGAGTSHLLKLTMRESSFIAAAASILSAAIAATLVPMFVGYAPAGVPRLAEAKLDWSAVTISAVLIFAYFLAVNLALTLGSRTRNVMTALQAGGNTSTISHRTLFLRHATVAVQLSVVLALLISAALVTGTLWRMLAQPLGFQPEGVIVARVTPTRPYFTEPARYQEVMDTVRREAQIAVSSGDVALTLDAPLADWSSQMRVGFPDRQAAFVLTKFVSDKFFHTMQIPLLAGRDFQASDFATGEFVIVNELFARTYLGGIDRAVGREIDFGTRQQVVGVVGNVREEMLTVPMSPTLYPVLASAARRTPGVFHIVIRPRAVDSNLTIAIAQAVHRADSTAHVSVSPLTERMRVQTAATRTLAVSIGTIAVSTAFLACLGIYAIVAQVVGERQREMAVRSALGASRRSLIATTASRIGFAAIVGLGVGCVVSWAAVRLTRQFLFQTTPHDPLAWSAAVILLGASVLIAAWLPARRAASISPAVLLREP